MNNNLSQNNPSDNIHKSNFTVSINGINNTFPPTTSPNANHLNASFNYNDYNDYVPAVNRDIFPAHPPVTSNNNVHSHQQSMPNNTSTSQYPQQYPQYIDQNPLQNVFPHSLNITINSPQTNIIFMSSDMQNQLQQGRTYLNHFPSNISTNHSQTQFQQ